MRISDWSSDVCSSDLAAQAPVLLGGHAEATGLAEVSHYLPHLGAVALEEVEQQALEVGRDLDVHGRRDGRADAADGHGAAVEEAGQDVVAVGADVELGHRQAHEAGCTGGVKSAEGRVGKEVVHTVRFGGE